MGFAPAILTSNSETLNEANNRSYEVMMNAAILTSNSETEAIYLHE